MEEESDPVIARAAGYPCNSPSTAAYVGTVPVAGWYWFTELTAVNILMLSFLSSPQRVFQHYGS